MDLNGDSELPSFVIRPTISFNKDSSLKTTDKAEELTDSNRFGLRSNEGNGNSHEIVQKPVFQFDLIRCVTINTALVTDFWNIDESS